MRRQSRILPALGFVLFFLLCVSVFGPGDFTLSWDLSTYVTVGKNLASGRGVEVAPGESMESHLGFSATLAALFRLFGPSVAAAVWFLALTSALTATLLLALGCRLFGKTAGFLGAALFVATPEVLASMPQQMDGLWPGAVLGALLLLHRPTGTPRGEWFIGALAGLALAYATLVKETAAVVLPVPLALAFLSSIPRSRQRLTALHVVLGLGLVSGILAHQAIADPDPGEASTTAAEHAGILARIADGGGPAGAVRLISFGFQGVGRYFFSSEAGPGIHEGVPLVPWMLLAFGVVAGRAVLGDGASRTLVLMVLAFLPVLGYCGQLGLRFGQALLVVALLNLALAAEITRLVRALLARVSKLGSRLVVPCLLAVLVGLVLQQSHRSPDSIGTVLAASYAGRTAGGEPVTIRRQGEVLARWVLDEVPEGSCLMIPRADTRATVAWFAEGRYPLVDFPMQTLTTLAGNRHYPAATRPIRDPLLLTARFLAGRPARSSFFVLSEALLREKIEEQAVTHIVVVEGDWRCDLRRWLEGGPGITHQARVVDGDLTYHVYRVSRRLARRARSHETLVHPRVRRLLQWLHEHDSARFLEMGRATLGRYLGLEDQAIERLRLGNAPHGYRFL